MVEWGFNLMATAVRVNFMVRPVPIMLHSLILSNYSDMYSGISDWLTQLPAKLTPEQRQQHAIFCLNAPEDLVFDHMNATFPQFIQFIAQMSDSQFYDLTTNWMLEKPYFTSKEAILATPDAYIAFLTQVYGDKSDKGIEADTLLWRSNYDYLTQPAKLRALMVDFMGYMWETHFATEWKRTEPLLLESANAYSQMSFREMDATSILEAVTGRDMRGKDYFDDELAKTTDMIFMPSPHMGPYISWISNPKNSADIVLYGARLPRNTQFGNSALNRSELLVRLNALADETRLRMLEMLKQEGEICAQDFITALDLSQSSASRHLRQLTASGYVTERRRDVAKCYTLNRDRIKDTITALSQFLDK